MKKSKKSSVSRVVLAVMTSFCGHTIEAADQWPVPRKDRGSIIVVLEPEPSVQNDALAFTLSDQTGLIDASPWHLATQPFVKQYLVDPGTYLVQGSGDAESAKVPAEAGKATLLQLAVEEPLGTELDYHVTVSSVRDGENLDLDEAQSRVRETLADYEGPPQLYLSNVRTDGYDIQFGFVPVAELIPGLPWPVPAPNPNPAPQPPPQDRLQ